MTGKEPETVFEDAEMVVIHHGSGPCDCWACSGDDDDAEASNDE